jgi:hypothetical protein
VQLVQQSRDQRALGATKWRNVKEAAVQIGSVRTGLLQWPSIKFQRGALVNRRLTMVVSLMSACLLLMALVGQSHYTSLGIDHDVRSGDQVLASWLRVRWPGDGSLWVGGAGAYRAVGQRDEEQFDLGGVFFKAPQSLPIPRTAANRYGFWLVTTPAEDPLNPQGVWSFWVAAPAWLAALFIWLLPAVVAVATRSKFGSLAPKV